jgi:D-3-phosphoglycerate dehydrogenase
MAKPFYLVNTARGAVVNTDALVEGLESGKVRGVALDVLEYENMQVDGLGDVPESMKYLMQSSRTVLTPHIAGWTVESKYKLAAVLADKMIEVLK